MFDSPTWWVRSGEGSLDTCNTLWNAKTTLWQYKTDPATWTHNPAYEPFNNKGYTETNPDKFVNNNQKPFPFCLMPSPGRLRKSYLQITSNSMSVGFKVYLGRDGPIITDTSATPTKNYLLFDVPEKTDPSYTTTYKFPSGASSVDSANIPLWGGRSYGFIFEADNAPTAPSGSLTYSIGTVIYFGGATAP